MAVSTLRLIDTLHIYYQAFLRENMVKNYDVVQLAIFRKNQCKPGGKSQDKGDLSSAKQRAKTYTTEGKARKPRLVNKKIHKNSTTFLREPLITVRTPTTLTYVVISAWSGA